VTESFLCGLRFLLFKLAEDIGRPFLLPTDLGRWKDDWRLCSRQLAFHRHEVGGGVCSRHGHRQAPADRTVPRVGKTAAASIREMGCIALARFAHSHRSRVPGCQEMLCFAPPTYTDTTPPAKASPRQEMLCFAPPTYTHNPLRSGFDFHRRIDFHCCRRTGILSIFARPRANQSLIDLHAHARFADFRRVSCKSFCRTGCGSVTDSEFRNRNRESRSKTRIGIPGTGFRSDFRI
jgi:hypothetical protein